MSALKVFHLSANVFPPFPEKHHTSRIWQELAQDADEYHVIASAGGLRYSHTHDAKIHLHLLPTLGRRTWSYSLSSWMVVILAVLHRPNRIVAQCPVHGGLVGAVCNKLLGVPLLTELHGSHYFKPVRPGWRGRLESRVYRILSRPAFDSSCAIRTLSGEMTQHLRRVYGEKTASKAVEIPNRVDLSIFSPPKSSYAIAGDLKVISVGSFVRLKGHSKLIKDLFTDFPRVHLTIVGRGPLERSYAELAAQLMVSGRIRLVYARSHAEVAALLQEADVYVHYAESEGVPRAILEAMAMGLPVVTTAVGFLGGIVTHDHDVLLLGSDGAESLSGVLRRLAGSAEERARLGINARQTIEQRFDWDLVFRRYRKAIHDCGHSAARGLPGT